MARGIFSRFFPPPRYLAPRVSGLDLSDRSLKFITFTTIGRGLALANFGEKEIPLDVISGGEIVNQAALVEILKQAKADWHLEAVIVSLPEERAYIVTMDLPRVAPSAARESLELQLEENVPLAAAEAVFDYEPLGQSKNVALVSVFPKSLAAAYESALREAGLLPLALEVEAQALARALIPAHSTEITLIVDFGRTRTSFFIAAAGLVIFTSTTRQLGGDWLTRSIEKNLALSTKEAESLKRRQGLLGGPQQAALLVALVPPLSALRDEIAKLVDYWRRRETGPLAAPTRILLSGGEAALPGLAEYLGGQLDLPIALGNVWTNALDLTDAVPAITASDALRYGTAIGLALRGQ